MNIKPLLCILALLLAPVLVQATHIYSGYISYTTDPQNPLKLNFEMTTYNYTASTASDPAVYINMGDGNNVMVERAALPTYSKSFYTSVFRWSHTYSSAGDYIVSWIAENRNGGILNLAPPTDQLAFYIQTNVKVGSSLKNLNSVKLAGTGVVQVFPHEPWTHNLLAYDADGDYLMYDLVIPKYRKSANEIANAPGYQQPEGLRINEFGELHWPNPEVNGQYVLNVRITEVRDGKLLGSTVVEMTLLVRERLEQPEISLINKDRLTVNEDGSIQTWPGQPVKLEFYLRNLPGHVVLPLIARQFGEIDTLQLVDTALQFRDTTNGYAIRYTFTPTPALERTEPYLIGLRSWADNKEPAHQYGRNVEFAWAFAYIYVGEQRRPLSSGDDFPTESPKLYPNPARGEFTFEAPDLPGLHLLVRDVTGKVVASYTLRPGRNDFARPAKLASGLYTYTLTSQLSPIETGKLVLQ
ncbi:T9SS type A sorting domain-containing protein [Pontibacter sp. BT731]|uniref:T9SS type A sorting domain-containing protein n=1 Tax=Pontibacter coccineus TaxID=3063328 RepID=UPI0026E28F9B|nr:T9SS type A sorting domain-containing protein [Pontibacter sp. BT731]MDO6389645.1 T9SS type A sorting domain-containing protein [Pontibacter sp. BT731]